MSEFPARRTGARGSLRPAEMRTEAVARGVHTLRLAGYFDRAAAERLVAALDDILARDSHCDVFIDAEGLSGYRPEFRQRLTEWHARAKERLGTLNILVRLKMLSMAVAVASLANGRSIQTFADRKAYDVAVRAAVDRRRSR